MAQLVAQWQADVQRLRWVREGALILGNRKRKYSVFTRYTFDRGWLNGLFVGGGYRYQSKAPIGFDLSEISSSAARRARRMRCSAIASGGRSVS